jgi:hypothetical protein
MRRRAQDYRNRSCVKETVLCFTGIPPFSYASTIRTGRASQERRTPTRDLQTTPRTVGEILRLMSMKWSLIYS